jgi:hypothetical protein
VLTRREKHQAALTAQEGPIDIAKAINQRIDTLAVESRRFQLGNDLFFQPVTLTLFRGTERVIVQIRCAKIWIDGNVKGLSARPAIIARRPASMRLSIAGTPSARAN